MTAAGIDQLVDAVNAGVVPSGFFAALTKADHKIRDVAALQVENAKLRLRISDLTGECVRCSSTDDVRPFLKTRLCAHCLEHGTIGDLHPMILGLQR